MPQLLDVRCSALCEHVQSSIPVCTIPTHTTQAVSGQQQPAPKMSSIRVHHPSPDVRKGVAYWEGVPSTVDGVLGGYGTGTLPRIDALGSRTFLLRTLSHLANVPPASAEEDPVEWREGRMRVRAAGGAGAGGKASGSGGAKAKAVTRALDCGAGVGRVSENSLLPILDEVHLVEPVEKVSRAKVEAKSEVRV